MWVRVLGSAWNGAIYAVGIVTIVFAILDHEKLRITALDAWKPENLPEPQPGRPIPRSETVMGLVFTLTFLIWWIDLVRVPDFWFYAGESLRLEAAPIWRTLYYPILASLIASVGVYLIDLVRPWRTLTVSAVDLVINLANVGDHHDDSPRRPLRGRVWIGRPGRGPGAGRLLAQHHHRRGRS